MKKLAFVVLLSAAVPGVVFAQAQTSLSSLRVGYNTHKATVKPEGDLKAQIDAVDRDIAEATRLGRTGELRRLIAKGNALLAGRAWTPELEFTTSVVIRTNSVVADSSKPFTVRLEQIYVPSMPLEQPLTAHVTLRERPSTAANSAPRPGVTLRDLGSFDGIPRDLRDTPFTLDLNAQGIEDGTYQLVADLSEGTHMLGEVALPVHLRNGLDELVTRLEAAAAAAPSDVRADILYPVDRMRHVNSGLLELRTFDPAHDFAEASAVAARLGDGANPVAHRTGDFKRHYRLERAGEIMPYHMYVPTTYDGSRTYPLIIALHGLGNTEDSFFDNYEKALPPLAEQHGYIVAAPLGYRVDGAYGWDLGTPPADPAIRRLQERSEADVMEVLRLVRQQYKVDANRIYLAGHSMGAIGTWRIAPKYPEIWAAIAAISGQGQPATLERIRHIPEIVVHGDNDPTVNVQGSRAMVARARELGIELKYLEVPGGTHSSVVAPNLPAVFDFFDAHTRRAPLDSRQD